MNRPLAHLSDSDLIRRTRELKNQEDKTLVELLDHIREIEFRKLFLELGYTSLYKYLCDELGYAEGEAYRRIEAARLIRELPETRQKIEAGVLTLSSIAEVRGAIKREELRTGAPVDHELKERLVQAVEGLSARASQSQLATMLPSAIDQRERVIERRDGAIELHVQLNPKERQTLDRCRDVLAHKAPMSDYRTVITTLAHDYLRTKDRGKMTQRFLDVEKTVRNPPNGRSGRTHIPAALKRAVFARDGGRCQYQTALGNICGQTYQVEIDHIVPVRAGGRTELGNLRCLCRVHNQWKG